MNVVQANKADSPCIPCNPLDDFYVTKMFSISFAIASIEKEFSFLIKNECFLCKEFYTKLMLSLIHLACLFLTKETTASLS